MEFHVFPSPDVYRRSGTFDMRPLPILGQTAESVRKLNDLFLRQLKSGSILHNYDRQYLLNEFIR